MSNKNPYPDPSAPPVPSPLGTGDDRCVIIESSILVTDAVTNSNGGGEGRRLTGASISDIDEDRTLLEELGLTQQEAVDAVLAETQSHSSNTPMINEHEHGSSLAAPVAQGFGGLNDTTYPHKQQHQLNTSTEQHPNLQSNQIQSPERLIATRHGATHHNVKRQRRRLVCLVITVSLCCLSTVTVAVLFARGFFSLSQTPQSDVGVTCPVTTNLMVMREEDAMATINHTAPFHSSQPVTYHPGKLIESALYPGLWLSKGLQCQKIAQSYERVSYCQQRQEGGQEQQSMPYIRKEKQQNLTQSSRDNFHSNPDSAGSFEDTRPENTGGWIYVSNAEVDHPRGGVGALTFDKSGRVIDYRRVTPPRMTKANCGGGTTPWNTWITCEEFDNREDGGRAGHCWQVDPTGQRAAEKTQLGGTEGGNFESAAVDYRNPLEPRFFVTEDAKRGALRRYTPSPQTVAEVARKNNSNVTDSSSAWRLLHESGGTLEYLVFDNTAHKSDELENVEAPTAYNDDLGILANNNTAKAINAAAVRSEQGQSSASQQQETETVHHYFDQGNFYWSADKTLGMDTAEAYYPSTEGIDFVLDEETGSDGILYFISKAKRRIFRLNLNTMEYTSSSTEHGTFDGQPDQIKKIVADNGVLYTYFTEDGKYANGIHGRDKYHRSFTVLEGDASEYGSYVSETTGLAFSPDHRHLYVAFQKEGVLFDCTREDGFTFKGRTIDMRYHKQ